MGSFPKPSAAQLNNDLNKKNIKQVSARFYDHISYVNDVIKRKEKKTYAIQMMCHARNIGGARTTFYAIPFQCWSLTRTMTPNSKS